MDVEKIGILYSNECIKRNREYLLKTCPSVVKPEPPPVHVPQQEIEDYFDDRLWPYGVVNYKFKREAEFSKFEFLYVSKCSSAKGTMSVDTKKV